MLRLGPYAPTVLCGGEGRQERIRAIPQPSDEEVPDQGVPSGTERSGNLRARYPINQSLCAFQDNMLEFTGMQRMEGEGSCISNECSSWKQRSIRRAQL